MAATYKNIEQQHEAKNNAEIQTKLAKITGENFEDTIK